MFVSRDATQKHEFVLILAAAPAIFLVGLVYIGLAVQYAYGANCESRYVFFFLSCVRVERILTQRLSRTYVKGSIMSRVITIFGLLSCIQSDLLPTSLIFTWIALEAGTALRSHWAVLEFDRANDKNEYNLIKDFKYAITGEWDDSDDEGTGE